jgi:hypothetical protein
MSISKIPTKSAAPRSFQDPAVERRKICSLLTRPLGLLGWETLEPVLLAALTTSAVAFDLSLVLPIKLRSHLTCPSF